MQAPTRNPIDRSHQIEVGFIVDHRGRQNGLVLDGHVPRRESKMDGLAAENFGDSTALGEELVQLPMARFLKKEPLFIPKIRRDFPRIPFENVVELSTILEPNSGEQVVHLVMGVGFQ